MISNTAVKVTTVIRLPWNDRMVAKAPTINVATHGAPRFGSTFPIHSLMTVGQARSRPAAQTMRANCSVMARAAFRIANDRPDGDDVVEGGAERSFGRVQERR